MKLMFPSGVNVNRFGQGFSLLGRGGNLGASGLREAWESWFGSRRSGDAGPGWPAIGLESAGAGRVRIEDKCGPRAPCNPLPGGDNETAALTDWIASSDFPWRS